jgi:tether containing UBX domain for GLUT4
VDAPNTAAFKLYKPATSQIEHPSPDDIPDSYFTPTAADLKVAQATLSARTQALVNAPLQLRAQREAVEKSKRDRWPNTTIRIKFTDRTQLEKSFSSTDKIRAVYAFVRSSLRDDVKHIKFILYQSPPKRDLKVSDPNVRDLNLSALQLSPSSVLLLRFEDESLNRSDIPAPLMPSIMAHATDLPLPPNFGDGTSKLTQDTPPSEPKQSAERKVPKWLKVGLKK